MFNFLYSINKSPIIILGNQKSGTTAIATLLAKRANINATIDTSVLWEPNLSKLLDGEFFLRDVIRKNKKPFVPKIIKEPNLTFFYNELKEIFINATYVFIVRDPRSNIRSLLNRINVDGTLDELKDKDINEIPFLWRSIFKNYFSSRAHYIDILADRWNFCSDVYLNNKNSMILLRYEDFLTDKLHYIDLVLDKLNILPVKNIDLILDKQFQPKGNSEILWNNFFEEKNLHRIEYICKDNMDKLGY